MRLFACALVLAACSNAGPDSHTESPAPTMSPTLDLARVNALVGADLAARHAATTKDLVATGSPRALVVAQSFSPPYNNGRTLIAVVGLAPGEPGNLPVPTELEYLRFTIAVAEDGSVGATSKPERADLVAAVERALADEGRAIAAADAALVGAKVALPIGVKSWRDAVRRATYDSRLPAAQFGGGVDPMWSFIFEPYSQASGGNQVILNSRLGVVMINGRAP